VIDQHPVVQDLVFIIAFNTANHCRKKTDMTREDRPGGASGGLTEGLPTQRLAQESLNLLEALAERAMDSIGEKVSETTRRLVEKAEGADGGGPGLQAAISGMTALVEDKGLVRAGLRAGATFLKEKIKQFFKGGKGKKTRSRPT
jgi:hypothetical protein